MTDTLKDRIARFRKKCELHGLTIMYDDALPLLSECQTRIEDMEAENRKLQEALLGVLRWYYAEGYRPGGKHYDAQVVDVVKAGWEAALADKGETK